VLLGLRLGLATMRLAWPQVWLLGLPSAVVYGSLALFTSILHNVFLLYYVDTFVSVYKINKTAFWVGEVGPVVGSSPGRDRMHRLPGRWQVLGPAQLGLWGNTETETQTEKLVEALTSPPGPCLTCSLYYMVTFNVLQSLVLC
jgi:hypothetical protein